MRRHPSEEGIALLIALLFLLVISALGVNALSRAQEENSSGASSRHRVVNLMAADAGIKLALNQLNSSSGFTLDTQPINIASLQGSSVIGATKIRSGVLGDPTLLPIEFIQYVADAKAGSQLNQGSGNGGGGQIAIYRVNIVADSTAGGSVRVQAQLAVEAPSVGY